jgi:hypothetical protein
VEQTKVFSVQEEQTSEHGIRGGLGASCSPGVRGRSQWGRERSRPWRGEAVWPDAVVQGADVVVRLVACSLGAVLRCRRWRSRLLLGTASAPARVSRLPSSWRRGRPDGNSATLLRCDGAALLDGCRRNVPGRRLLASFSSRTIAAEGILGFSLGDLDGGGAGRNNKGCDSGLLKGQG